MANANEFSQQIDYLNGGPLEKTWGPYPTKEAACLAIENKVDAEGRNMRMGKKVAIGTGTKYGEYAWIGGFEDEDLVEYTLSPTDNSVSTSKISDRAVTEEKTDFIRREVGKNKFNYNAIDIALANYLNENSNSQLFGKLQANSSYNTSGFIPVNPGDTIVNSPTVRSMVFYYASKNPIPNSGIMSPVSGTVTTVPPEAAYMRFSVAVGSWLTTQIEVGTSATAFEPYSERFVLSNSADNIYVNKATNALVEYINNAIKVGTLQVLDKSITPSKATFFDESIINLYNPDDPDVITGKYLNTSTGIPSRDNAVYKTTGFIKVNAGDVIVHGNNGSRINLRFIVGYGADKIRVAGSEDQTRTSWTVPAGVVYIRTSFASDTAPLYQIQKNAITAYQPYRIDYKLKSEILPLVSIPDSGITNDKLASDSVSTSKLRKGAVTKEKTDFFVSINLYNPADADIIQGSYLGSVGNIGANATYTISGYIPVKAGEVFTKSHNFAGGAYSAFYNLSKVYIADSASNAQTVTATQDGFLRVSIQVSVISQYQLVKGTSVGNYTPYKLQLDRDLVPDTSKNLVLDSIAGLQGKIHNQASLADGSTITINDFPYHIKKGISMSVYVDLSTLTGTIEFGKGLNQYRGDWLKIDSSKVYWMHYESAVRTDGEILHGLNIASFIKCTFYIDDSSKCNVILQSVGGYFKTTFNWGYEANYAAFLKTTGQELSNIKISLSSKEFRHPVWAFGDSYFGVTTNRWPGIMRSFGFFNFLLNGLAGQGSANARLDFERALKHGTPKYLLWFLGMNDTDAVFQSNLTSIIDTCSRLGITLILATIPTIPTRNKENISNIVRTSGYRYVDFYKAMGTNSSGVWYSGYLSTDGIHPNAIGAEALATQVLIDFPEIMQYGVTNLNGGIGNSTGDN